MKSPEFFERIKNPQNTTIDVRTKEEYDEHHIPGAINLDIYGPNFVYEISKMDKTKPYSVYCTSAGRSFQAYSYMKKQGFLDIENLTGGISTVGDLGTN